MGKDVGAGEGQVKSGTMRQGLPDLNTFRRHTLAFLDRCYPSSGVFDVDAWERSRQPTEAEKGSEAFDSDVRL